MLAERPRPAGLAECAAFLVAGGVAWTSVLALTLAASPASAAQSQDSQQIFDRLNQLDQRVGTLENAVKDRDAKIQTLENAVHERDATIESLKRSAAQPPQQGAAQFPAPAAGGAQPSGETQRIENLERTVRQLNEITNAQQEQIKPSDVKVTTKGGLKVETEDGQYSFSVFGRLMYDAAFYDQDKSKMGDGQEMRRARIGVGGKVFADWEYKFEMDFAGNESVIKDAFLKYAGWKPVGLYFGNQYEPQSFQYLTSSRFVTFMERAMPVTTFEPERHVGVKVDYYQPNWSVAGGVFGRRLEDTDPPNEGDQAFDIAGRVTFDPVHDETRLVHLGLSSYYRNPSDETVRFRERPESHITGVRFVDTGTIANVDHFYVVDPEAALIWGPASLQGEYFWVPVSRTQGSPDLDLSGWYAEVSYFLTGEMRNYEADVAKFERIKVLRPLGKGGGWGAFELAARISNVNLDDGPNFQKGNETNYTIGLNWYPMDHIRFMANYVIVRNNASATGNSANLLPGETTAGYDDPNIFEVRAQVDW